MTGAMILDPLLPWPVIWGLAGLAAVLVGLALWQRMTGALLRAGAALAVLAALANPSWQQEDRAPLSDILNSQTTCKSTLDAGILNKAPHHFE